MRSRFVGGILLAAAIMIGGCASGSDQTSGEAAPRSADVSHEEPPAEGKYAVVSGRVRRVGSEPFTELVVTDAAGTDWYLDQAGEELLRSMEQDEVVVRGIVVFQKLELADGTDLGTRHRLHEIKLETES